MSRRRRQTDDDLYHPADVVARILYHVHGVLPAYATDFRHAEEDEYPSEYGQHPTTKQGAPSNAESLGDADGRAQDTTNGNFEGGNPTAYSPGADSLTQIVSYQPYSIESAQELVFGWSSSGSAKAEINHDDNNPVRPKFNAADDNGNVTGANVSDGIEEGSDSLIAQVIDREGNDHRAFGIYDGRGSVAQVVGGLGFDANMTLDSAPVFCSTADASLQLVAAHHDWISTEQFAYIWEVLRDRTQYAPQLDRWMVGTPEDGFSRRLPDYLTPHSDDLDQWWTADRHVHQIDGEGATQLPDYSGTNRGVQRTDSDKPIVRGPTERGERADYVEVNKQQTMTIPGTAGKDLQDMTWACVFRAPGVGFDEDIIYHGSQSTNDADIRLTVLDDNTVRFFVRNSSQDTENLSIDESVSEWGLFVATKNSSGDALIKYETKSSSRLSASQNVFTGDYTADYDQRLFGRNDTNGDPANEIDADVSEIVMLEKSLSESEIDNLMDALTAKWGIT